MPYKFIHCESHNYSCTELCEDKHLNNLKSQPVALIGAEIECVHDEDWNRLVVGSLAIRSL